MIVVSHAATPAAFQNDLSVALQLRATQVYNRLQALRAAKGRKQDELALMVEFNTICAIRDFIIAIELQEPSLAP